MSRAATGWISDRFGSARVTFWTFLLMIAAVFGVLFFLMIPVIMRKEIDRLMPQLSTVERVRQAEKESAALIGFTSPVAAYGAFFIPQSYGTSISATGGPEGDLLSTWRYMQHLALG